MSMESTSTASRLEEFESHLRTAHYAAAIQRRYLWIAQRFIDYLGNKRIAVEAAHSPDYDDFLRWELRSWRRRHGRDPRNIFEWRRRYRTAMNVFLRLVHGHWPVAATPATAIEAFHCDLVRGYDTWMRELRGLASVTRSKRTTQALEFLTELGPRSEAREPCALGRSGHRCVPAAALRGLASANYRGLHGVPSKLLALFAWQRTNGSRSEQHRDRTTDL